MEWIVFLDRTMSEEEAVLLWSLKRKTTSV